MNSRYMFDFDFLEFAKTLVIDQQAIEVERYRERDMMLNLLREYSKQIQEKSKDTGWDK